MLFRTKKPSASAKGKGSRQETPFEARRRELAEQEAKLKAATEKHESFIKKAPKIAAEIQKEQREVFLRNAARVERSSFHGGIQLPDHRHLSAETMVPPRVRRQDRQQGKWLFFLLVFGLFIAAWWAWQTLFQSAF